MFISTFSWFENSFVKTQSSFIPSPFGVIALGITVEPDVIIIGPIKLGAQS